MNEIVRNILLGISVAAPLGPATLAIIRAGLRRGFFHAFLTGLGVTLADATYLLVVYFGLARLLGIPAVKVVVWIFGALVLASVGIQSLREAFGRLDFDRRIDPATIFTASVPPNTDDHEMPNGGSAQSHGNHMSPEARNPLLLGYLVNISNPIAIVWWVGIFGSLLSASVAVESRIVALLSSLTILLGILSWHTTLSLLTHWGKRVLNERTARIVTGIAGVTLILFGLRFAWLALSTLLQSYRFP